MQDDRHQPGKPAKTGPAKSKGTILLVEDDRVFIETVKSFLELAGFEVDCASNGIEGLKVILGRNYDIILCDLMMPHLPGDMFYIAVQRVRPELCRRFIFVTGYKGEKGMDDFIRKIHGTLLWKPFRVADLMATIDLVLSARAKPDGDSAEASAAPISQ